MKAKILIVALSLSWFSDCIAQSGSSRIEISPELTQKEKLIVQIDSLVDLIDRYKAFKDMEFQTEYLKVDGTIRVLDNLKYTAVESQSGTAPQRKYKFLKMRLDNLLLLLAQILELNNKNANLNEIRYLVEHIKHSSTLYLLNDVIYKKNSIVGDIDFPSSFIFENLTVISDYYKRRVNGDLYFYTIRDVQKKKIIAIELNHGNDFLDKIPMHDFGRPLSREEKHNRNFFWGNNHDRDMTGAFRLDLYTDYFQMRVNALFAPTLKILWNKIFRNKAVTIDRDPFYSYQSVFVTGWGETPMLRDTAVFSNVNSFDSLDRPYASYIGFGIAKHRLHRKGLYRTYQEFSIGKIGSGKPYGIQAQIHRDIVQPSLNPNGWGAQIAAGDTLQKRKNVKQGRLGAQYRIRHDLTFFSGNKNLGYLKNNNVPRGVNFYATGQLHYGCVLTALDIGLGYSNYGFNEQNGSGAVKRPNPRHREWIKFSAAVNVYYRRVVHNSMLEGFGYRRNMEDGDPYTPKSLHVIEKKYVERDLLIGNFNLNLSKNRVSLYLKYDFTSAEIKKTVGGINKYPHYFKNVFGYKTEIFYYQRRPSTLNLWGTIGAIFSL